MYKNKYTKLKGKWVHICTQRLMLRTKLITYNNHKFVTEHFGNIDEWNVERISCDPDQESQLDFVWSIGCP